MTESSVASAVVTPVTWDQLEVGYSLAPRVEPPFRITDFVMYQGAVKDTNPMHHDAAAAQAAGYPGPFAVGMLAAGVLAGYAAEHFGAENVRRFKVQFRGQAWPGDTIRYTGSVVRRYEDDHQRYVDLELSGTRQTGDVHVSAWATFVIP